MRKQNTLFKTYTESFYRFTYLVVICIIGLCTSAEDMEALAITVMLQSISNFYDMTFLIDKKRYSFSVLLETSLIALVAAFMFIISILVIAGPTATMWYVSLSLPFIPDVKIALFQALGCIALLIYPSILLTDIFKHLYKHNKIMKNELSLIRR